MKELKSGLPTNTLIDPAIPLSPTERREVIREAWRLWMRRPRNAALYSAGLALSITIFIFLPDAIDGLFGYHEWYFTLIAFVIYIAMLGAVFALVRRFHFAPCVYAALRDRHIDVCPRCGYWLHGLGRDVAHCPECGASRSADD